MKKKLSKVTRSIISCVLAALAVLCLASWVTAVAAEKAKSPLPKYTTLDLGKGVAMKLVLVPAGKFMMGSPDSEKDREIDEGPPHEVTISKPFYMGVYEVTQEQYEAVMDKNPSEGREVTNPEYKQTPAQYNQTPVNQVSWDDAVEFCKKLSAKTGKTVRLPTEAEWEYACRAGSKTRFGFGDKEAPVGPISYADAVASCQKLSAKTGKKVRVPTEAEWAAAYRAGRLTDKEATLGEHAWYRENSGSVAKPVGQKKPNAWGLYDMHGSVWEWCSDWYADSYGNAGIRDPQGPISETFHVVRGGGWISLPRYCRSAYRGASCPAAARFVQQPGFESSGFRVAMVTDRADDSSNKLVPQTSPAPK
ncbi:MAG: formylglycine-generating enzyme family protein [Planctomycetota bacterium]